MRGRRRKGGAMSELRPDAQADGERRVGVVEPARDVEAQRPYWRFPAHADAHAGMPVRFGAVEGAAAVDEHRAAPALREVRSEEHTSELQSLMRISYAVFCLKKKRHTHSTRN